ncbi:MAG: hypothetical protein RR605_04165 [Acinetobacter sp.]
MYLKSKLTGEIRYFDAGIQVSDYLNLEEYTPLDSAEIDKFKNPENYLSEEEKEQLRLMQFKPLTRRQFKLVLLKNGLLETVEQLIGSIEDPSVKTRIQIEYGEAERFERSNESVKYMLGLLDLTSEQVDEMWRYAMTL